MKTHILAIVLFVFAIIVFLLDHITPRSSSLLTSSMTRKSIFSDTDIDIDNSDENSNSKQTKVNQQNQQQQNKRRKRIHPLHTHSSPPTNLQIVKDKSISRQRSLYIGSKNFAGNDRSIAPKNSNYFTGMTFMIDVSDNNNNEKDGENNRALGDDEIIKNERGYADVNWNITFDCAEKVFNRFFKKSDSTFSKIINHVPSQVQQEPSLSHKFHYLVKENLNTLATLNDFGVRMRALGFCLKGGGVGVNRLITKGEWEDRGGTDHLSVHPSILAMHGGVSPLRALVQGMRSGQYLISNSPVTEEFLMVRNDPDTFAPTMSLSRSAVGDSTIQSLYLSTLFSPLIFQQQQQSSSSAATENEKKLLQLHYKFAQTTELEQNRFHGIDDEKQQEQQQQQQQQQQQKRKQEEKQNSDEPFVIVDLGTGHASLLNAMCPMNSHIWCYGVDFAPKLMDQGSYFFPHLDLRPGVSAPHIPTGTVDAVFSNGVMGIIKYLQNCGHLREIIRLMRPGRGIAQVWHPATYQFNRFHPSFFVADEDTYFPHHQSSKNKDDEEYAKKADAFMPSWEENNILVNLTEERVSELQKAADEGMMNNNNGTEEEQGKKDSQQQQHHALVNFKKVLSRCPGNLGKFLSRVDIVADDPHVPIFTPMWTKRFLQPCAKCQGGSFGIRLFRNEREYGNFDEETPNFEPEKMPDNSGTLTFEPPGNLATTLKAPMGLVDCLSSPGKWQKCSELDASTIKSVFDCGDRLVKMGYSGKKRIKAWCPEVHTAMVEKTKAFRKEVEVLQPGKKE